MEIIMDEPGTTKFYDEAFSVLHNRKKVIKNPNEIVWIEH